MKLEGGGEAEYKASGAIKGSGAHVVVLNIEPVKGNQAAPFKNTKEVSSMETPPEPPAVNIQGPIVAADPPSVEKASAETVATSLAHAVNSQWTCVHTGRLVSVDQMEALVKALLPAIDQIRKAQDAYFWTCHCTWKLSKDETRAQAKHASIEILGMGLIRLINKLSNHGLICSLVIQAPPTWGGNPKKKHQSEENCLGRVFQLHEDLWQSMFDVWTSDKQHGGALQTWIFFRLPKYRAICAQKVAKMICKCKWQTHQFNARVTFEGRDSLREPCQGQDPEHDQGWEVSMSGIPLQESLHLR